MQKLRYHLKREILAVFQVLVQMHHEKLTGTEEELVAALAECQQAAIAVGNKLEAVLDEPHGIVSLLEEYCEELYRTAKDFGRAEAHIGRLDHLAQTARERVKAVDVYFQIVFMPYKASMWDSLESIYLAAKEDPDCQCLVVPLPYYNINLEKKTAEPMYEGSDFPPDVPITHYEDYSLETSLPDVVYIHYPYDGYNRVTNIHPDYCSNRLKKYTECLVYVPYYVTAGYFSENHRNLPVYQYMDYMIAQSGHFKEEARGLPYYDKILPLGSPKLDRVIRICREGRPIPSEWRPMLEGKKTVMLNTSLNCILADTGSYLKKLKALFQYFQTRSDVGLIWRPHPLLKATVESMRPEYIEELDGLMDYFCTNQVGVLDQTPDLTSTIAISDAYLGENSSSVINLFGAAGKPMLILNNYIFKPFSDEEKRRLRIAAMERWEGSWWILNGLGMFRVKEDWGQAEYLGQVPEAPLWTAAYNGMAFLDGKFYLAPYMSPKMAAFLPGQESYEAVAGPKTDVDYRFRKVIAYGRRLFYLPQDHPAIWEYAPDTGEWKEHGECIRQWRLSASDPRYEDVYDGVVIGQELWMTAAHSHLLLRFNLETGVFRFLELGQKGLGYSGIAADGRNLWVAETQTGSIICLDLNTKKAKIFPMPGNFRPYASSYGRRLAHLGLADMGEYIVCAPGFSNSMVKLDKESGEVSLLRPDLWQTPKGDVNGYSPMAHFTSYFFKKLDHRRVMVGRSWDVALLELDVVSGKETVSYPKVSEECLRKLENQSDGFEKIDTVAEFSRKENFIFSLEGFLDDLVSGRLERIKERQKKELRTLAANLDGSCGEKVHECIKEKCESRADH